MIYLRTPNQRGFTIIELLIIIVVVGILAALVLNSFATVQAKARDTQRKTDINAVATQLEACYADTCANTYPTLVNLVDTEWVAAHLKNLNKESLFDNNNNQIQGESVRQSAQYQYSPLPAGCTGAVGTEKPCTGFILTAFQETGDPYVKNSLNK